MFYYLTVMKGGVMPLRVPSTTSKEHLSGPEHPVPTQRNIQGSAPPPPASIQTAESLMNFRLPQKKRRRPGSQIPDMERPYQTFDNGKIGLYRVQPPGKAYSYFVMIDEYEIGPFSLIQEARSDRERVFIRTAGEVARIPKELIDAKRARYVVASHVHDEAHEDHFVFVDERETTEAAARMIAEKYPNPRRAMLPHAVRNPARSWLMIDTTSKEKQEE
jgi:hypothetical protein